MCPYFGWGAEQTAIQHMSWPLVERILREAHHLGLSECIPATRSEPLLYESMDRLLSLCGVLGIQVNLTSNGSFPYRSVSSWFSQLNPVCSDIKFSMHRLEQPEWGLVEAYLSYKPKGRISLQITACNDNASELLQLVQRARNLGLQRVKIHPLWVHRSEQSSLAMSPEAWLRVQEVLSPWMGFVQILPQSAPQYPCPFWQREIWIECDGSVRACFRPDYTQQGMPVLGNILQESLTEIWMRYMQIKRPQFCGQCVPVAQAI